MSILNYKNTILTLTILLSFYPSIGQRCIYQKIDTLNQKNIQGQKTGKWVSLDIECKLYIESWYSFGSQDSFYYVTLDGERREVEYPVREYPQLIGNNDSLTLYLKKNIDMSNIKFDYSGRIYFVCIIEPDSNISEVRVMNGSCLDCATEIKRVVKKAPRSFFPQIDYQDLPVLYYYYFEF